MRGVNLDRKTAKSRAVLLMFGFGYHLAGYVLKNAYFVKHNESK